MAKTTQPRMFMFDWSSLETRTGPYDAHPTCPRVSGVAVRITDAAEVMGHGIAGMFMVRDGALFEVRRIPVNGYGSWFVGDSIVSDGGLTTVTRFDPLYLVLPALLQSAATFVPLLDVWQRTDAVLPVSAGISCASLKGCEAAVRAVCDVRTDAASGCDLLRLSRDKLQALFLQRLEGVARAMQTSSSTMRTRLTSTFAAFSTSSAVSTGAATPAGTSPGTGSRIEAGHLEAAAGVLLEYVPAKGASDVHAAHAELLRRYGYTAASAATPALMDTTNSEANSTPGAAWNAAALAEGASPSAAKFVSIGRSSPDDAGSAPAAVTKPALTVAQKRLAATNIKGMKSLNSWFVAPKPTVENAAEPS